MQEQLEKYLAVDVALIPPESIMDKAISANQKISQEFTNQIKLNKKDCFPHITLAMGCVREGDIDGICEKLAGVARKFKEVHLSIVPSGEKKAWFRIRKAQKLQVLHDSIMTTLFGFFSYEVKEDMLCRKGSEKVNPVTLDYIRCFPAMSSFVYFTPHITIGSGEANLKPFQAEFMASRLALCHLGNFCTCKKFIASYDLQK